MIDWLFSTVISVVVEAIVDTVGRMIRWLGRAVTRVPRAVVRPIRQSGSNPRTLLARIALTACVAVAVSALAVTIRHAMLPLYYVPPWGITIATSAAFLSTLGAALSWNRPRLGLIALFAWSALLTQLTFLGMLTIGMLVLPFALLTWGAAVYHARRAPNGKRSALSGVLVGLGLPVAIGLASQNPLVECHADGTAATGGQLFLALGSTHHGGSSSGPNYRGVTRGEERGSNYSCTYECRGDKLTRFEFEKP